LPNRVYLKRIETETADVTWRLRGKHVGFFGTRLLVTPHGRDFDYQAAGGTLNMTPIPDLYLRAPVLPFPARAREGESEPKMFRGRFLRHDNFLLQNCAIQRNAT
jgi:hypothetical protein